MAEIAKKMTFGLGDRAGGAGGAGVAETDAGASAIAGADAAALAVVLALSIIFITVPAFFERLHSDEVIYWEVARNIARGRGMVSETLPGGGFLWHAPLPYFIVAPFLWLSEHIFTARVVSSIFTAGSASLVCLISARRFTHAESVVSALIFIMSFQAMRYGGRFYLDQYGVFFFLLAFWLMGRGRMITAGAAAVLMVASREYWLGMLPAMAVYVYLTTGGRSLRSFILPAVVAAASAAAIVVAGAAVGDWGGATLAAIWNGAITSNLAAVFGSHPPGELAERVAKGWAEYAAVNMVLVAGFAAWLFSSRSWLHLLLVVPMLLVISMVHGFVIDGGVTQYAMAVTAVCVPFAGRGLKVLADCAARRVLGQGAFTIVAAVVVSAQFVGLNAAATAVSLHDNAGVYGLGYSPDREVIRRLRAVAAGEYIFGVHGAFVDDRSRWGWTDYMLQEGIETGPDWLVTYSNYVELTADAASGHGAEVSYVGPYVMVHAAGGREMRELVGEKGFDRWRGTERR